MGNHALAKLQTSLDLRYPELVSAFPWRKNAEVLFGAGRGMLRNGGPPNVARLGPEGRLADPSGSVVFYADQRTKIFWNVLIESFLESTKLLPGELEDIRPILP